MECLPPLQEENIPFFHASRTDLFLYSDLCVYTECNNDGKQLRLLNSLCWPSAEQHPGKLREQTLLISWRCLWIKIIYRWSLPCPCIFTMMEDTMVWKSLHINSTVQSVSSHPPKYSLSDLKNSTIWIPWSQILKKKWCRGKLDWTRFGMTVIISTCGRVELPQ